MLRAIVRVPDRLAYTLGGLGIVVVWLLPFRVVEEARARRADGLLDVGRRRAPHRGGRDVGRDLQRRRAARRDRWPCSAGSARSSAVLRISVAYPLRNATPHRHDPRDVHPRGVHARGRHHHPERRSSPRRTRRDVRRRLRRARDDLASDPIADMGGRIAHEQAHRCQPGARRRQQSYVPVKARQAGAAAKFVDYPLRGLDAAFLAQNHYPLGSRAVATPRTGRCGTPWPGAATSRWSTPGSCRTGGTGTSAPSPT